MADGMKVLLCSPDSGLGGIVRWTELIAGSRSGFGDVELTLMPMNSNLWLRRFLGRAVGGVVSYLMFMSGFSRRLRRERYDVVHISSSGSIGLLRDLLMMRICKVAGVPVVVQFHYGRIPLASGWERFLLHKVCSGSGAVVVLDRATERCLRSSYRGEGVYKVVNPVKKLDIESDSTVCGEYGLSGGESPFFFVGRICREKGVADLVEAVRQEDCGPMHLFGPVERDLRRYIASLEREDSGRVVLEDERDRKSIYCRMAGGVLVLPSLTEAFPNVVLEAMVCGLPVIATRTGAIEEILSLPGDADGEDIGRGVRRWGCGLSVAPGDVAGLRHAIGWMRHNSAERRRMGINGKKKSEECYNTEIARRQLEEIWKSIVAKL